MRLFKLFSCADKYDYGLMALGTLGGIGNGLAVPIFYYIFAHILHSFGMSPSNPQKTADDVAKYALDLLYVGIATFVCASAEMACWTHTGERQASKWMQKYLQALISQDVKFFDENAQTGEDISKNMQSVKTAISMKMGILAQSMATCIGGFAVTFFLMWKIGMVTLAFIPALFIAHVFYAHLLTNKRYTEPTWSIVEQTIEHIQTVYSYNIEERAVQLFSSSVPCNSSYGLTRGFGWGLVVGMPFFTYPFFFWYGGVLVRRDEVSGGRAVAAIFCAFTSASILLDAVIITTAFSKGREAVNDIIGMMNKAVPTMSEKDVQLSEVRGDLELQNIAFNYASNPNGTILRDVSFSIPSGRTVALVGAHGSGKSTLVSLIERLYDPRSGRILLDNTDISTLHLGWFRDQIGLINQEPLLFATSILKNILHGKEGATMEEVEAAARAANAHSFITKLPDAYKTQVGQACNVQLSDDQKQRLVIARTILKNPKLLLLDEPTCGYNAASEEKVQNALEHLMVERSTLLIAHKLSTIQNVYAVNVLQDGRIIEMGTHNQLFRQNELGPYSTLVEMQEMALGVDGTVLGRTSIEASSTAGVSICCKNHLTKRHGQKPTRHQTSMDTDEPEETANEDEVVAITLERSPERATRIGSLWKLLKMIAPLWPCICLGSIGAILGGALLNPILGFMVGELLEVFYEKNTHKMERDVQKYVLVLVGVGVVAIGIQMVQQYYFGIVAEILGIRVKEMIFREALRNEVGWFDLADNGGKKLRDQLPMVTTNLRILFLIGAAVVLSFTANLITACIVGFVLDWRYTLAMLGIFLLLEAGGISQELCSVKTAGLSKRSNAHSNSIIRDAIGNIRTIYACNGKELVVSLSKEALHEHANKCDLFRSYMFGIFFGLAEMTFYCSSGLILWYGSTLVKNGTSDFGSIIKVFLLFFGAAQGATKIVEAWRSTIGAFKTLHSTLALIDRQTSIEADDVCSEVVQSIDGSIDFVDVEFAYPTRPDVTIFRGLNLNIKARQRIALVGAKGSGKSSLIALVQRFYDSSKGSVMIDGKDIRGWNLRSLRQNVGLVQSDPVLFNTSIYENILYGLQEATQDEVQRAAEAAEAHIFIQALQAGYNTKVGDSTVQLSRGQQQRVAIARVALKNPAILLVDDATAGLDSQQEKVVQAAIDHLMVDRTTILVTHNLPDICMEVDSICVVKGGHIVEQGTHGKLMETNGSYARLFNIQRHAQNRRRRSSSQ